MESKAKEGEGSRQRDEAERVSSLLSARRARWRATLAVSAAVLVILVVVSSSLGYAYVSPSEVLSVLLGLKSPVSPTDATILMQIRFPRIVGALMVGAALAVSGTVLQDIFWNPLADPFVTGVSSGAAFGAALSLVLGVGGAVFGSDSTVVLAFVSAMVSVMASFLVAGNRSNSTVFLLSGVTVTFLNTAGLAFLTLVAGDRLPALVFWLMGGLGGITWGILAYTLPVVLAGIMGMLYYSRDMNALLFGEEQAKSLGVDTRKVRAILVGLAALVTATSVSVSGVIGFVGLIVPHSLRLVVGPDHRILIPSSILVGGSFLLLSDTVARTVFLPLEVPVGVVTGVVGGLFFIYLLRHQRRFVLGR